MARLEPARSCALPLFGKEGAGLHGPVRPLRSPRGRWGASQAGLWALVVPRIAGLSRLNPTILQPGIPELGRSSPTRLALSARCRERFRPRAQGSAGRNLWERPEEASREGLRRHQGLERSGRLRGQLAAPPLLPRPSPDPQPARAPAWGSLPSLLLHQSRGWGWFGRPVAPSSWLVMP